MDTFPSADMVARAIVAASKETGADPLAVARGDRFEADGGTYQTSRARAYAAMALKAAWQGCGAPALARMVGASSIASYIGNIEFQRRHGNPKWWRDDAFARVIKATSAEPILRQDKYGPLNMRAAVAKNPEIVTGSFLGDPAPGRSALDQKRAEA